MDKRRQLQNMAARALLVCSISLLVTQWGYILSDELDGTTSDLSDVLIIVITQSHQHHIQQAHEFKKHITDQLTDLNQSPPTVVYSHKRWPQPGAWTILPILQDVAQEYPEKKWILFCDDGTRIKLGLLETTVNRHSYEEPIYLGRGLRDQEATIIHHFAFHESPESFVYPDLYAGFIMSKALVKKISQRLSESKPTSDFSIDAIHELAMYIRDGGQGELLIEDSSFCTGDEGEACTTSYPQHFPQCESKVDNDKVFFAVKTCEKFHRDRVPVVKKTWGRDAKNLVFYSEIEDPSIPTEATGVPNTERGHCGKMMVILNKFSEAAKDGRYEWLVIADDDTLLSVPRLLSLLSCYDSSDPVALGERYGYSLMNNYGYDYITGGGGMVLNRLAVHLLVEGGLCVCGSDDSPDDMTLGMCLKRLAIPVTHSPLFHQARPADYAKGLLAHQHPVSFHKHWMIKPISVYEEWFGHRVVRDEL